jgi:hypothetical protein
MKPWTRREFNRSFLAVLPAVVFTRVAWATNAFAPQVREPLQRWALRLDQICRDLETHELTPVQWQDETEALFSEVSLRDVIQDIDLERLVAGIEYPDDHAATRRVTLPDIAGMERQMRWGPRVFALQCGRAIVPHAHNNMVSSHFVLRGEFHVRTFQRVRDDENHIVIEPSIDRVFQPGEVVTMSDQRDNVHWFVARSDHAFTFDVPVVDLFPGREYPTPAQYHGMIYIDPAGDRTSDGYIRAPVMDPEASIRKYGKT